MPSVPRSASRRPSPLGGGARRAGRGRVVLRQGDVAGLGELGGHQVPHRPAGHGTHGEVPQADAEAAEVAVKYGDFLQQIVNFLIIAFVIFLVIKAYNRMRAPAADAPPPEDVLLLREIRDSLKK